MASLGDGNEDGTLTPAWKKKSGNVAAKVKELKMSPKEVGGIEQGIAILSSQPPSQLL